MANIKKQRWFIDVETNCYATEIQKEFRNTVMKKYFHTITDDLPNLWNNIRNDAQEIRNKNNTLAVMHIDEYVNWINCYTDTFSMRVIAKKIKEN